MPQTSDLHPAAYRANSDNLGCEIFLFNLVNSRQRQRFKDIFVYHCGDGFIVGACSATAFTRLARMDN